MSRDNSETMEMLFVVLQKRFHVTAVRVRTEERASIGDFIITSASACRHITTKTAKGVGFGFESKPMLSEIYSV